MTYYPVPPHMRSGTDQQKTTAKPEKPSYFREASRDGDGGHKRDAHRIANARHDVDRMEEMLRENHHAIETCADLLNQSQPPMAGKIEARWWKAGDNGQTKPVIIQWGENGQTKQISWKGLRRRCNSRASFQVNLEQTKKLLSVLEELMAARKFMLTKLTYLARERKKAERFHAALVCFKKDDRFNAIYQQIASNMRPYYEGAWQRSRVPKKRA